MDIIKHNRQNFGVIEIKVNGFTRFEILSHQGVYHVNDLQSEEYPVFGPSSLNDCEKFCIDQLKN